MNPLFTQKNTASIMKLYFSLSKKDSPSLTIDRFAKRIAIGKSSLKMILSGKRKPTLHQVLSFARGMSLSASETSYLETLHLSDSAKNKWEQSYYNKILNDKRSQIKINTIKVSKLNLLSSPIILPLLVFLMENKITPNDIPRISKQLKISEVELTKLINQLSTDKDLLNPSHQQFHLSFDKTKNRLQQKNFIKSNIELSLKKVEEEYENPLSFFINYSFTANEENLLKIQWDLKQLMEKYMTEGSDKKKNILAQAHFQIFPLIITEK